MANRKKLDEEIKKSFEQINSKPPAGLWDKLSESLPKKNIDLSTLDQSLYNKIKESYASIKESAPAYIWDNINKSLNIERAWKSISTELDKKQMILKYGKWAASLLFLLLSLAVYLSIDFIAGRNETLSQIDENINTISDTLTYATKKDGNLQFTPAGDNLTSQKNEVSETTSLPLAGINGKKLFPDLKNRTTRNKANSNSEYITGGLDSPGLVNTKEETLNKTAIHFERSNELKFLRGMNIEKSLVTDLPGPITLQLVEFPETPITLFKNDLGWRAKVGIGLFYAYDNTWFLNHETKRSLEKGSLSTTEQTFVSNYGIVIQFSINPQSAISLDFQSSSKAEQNYYSFKRGHYIDEAIHLNYTKLAFLYHRSLFVNPMTSQRWVVAGGFYVASLNHSHSHRNGAEESLPYYASDLGLKLAVGQERKIGRFSVGYGIKTERGLKNIYIGTAKIPSDFNRTYNFSLGVYVNARYTLK